MSFINSKESQWIWWENLTNYIYKVICDSYLIISKSHIYLFKKQSFVGHRFEIKRCLSIVIVLKCPATPVPLVIFYGKRDTFQTIMLALDKTLYVSRLFYIVVSENICEISWITCTMDRVCLSKLRGTVLCIQTYPPIIHAKRYSFISSLFIYSW